MRIIVGVDTKGHYRNTLNLVARLNFVAPEWTIAHSMEPGFPVFGYGMPGEGEAMVELARLAKETALKTLDTAKDEACAHSVRATTKLLSGEPAGSLMEFADAIDADLIAVHSDRKGRFGSLFLGSVGRGLAIGARQSVLISKGPISPQGPLNAVFATDHSEYATRALGSFLKMRPNGIARIHVVSALDVSAAKKSVYPSVVTTHIKEVRRQTKAAVRRLTAAGYSVTGKFIDKPTNEAIAQAMQEIHADLLVMGAQGHGFLHRLLLGSTVLHQVVAEPYSILIVRAPGGSVTQSDEEGLSP